MAWITKKIRGGIKCLEENGFSYTTKLLCKKIAKKILPYTFLKIAFLFINEIIRGYNIYKKYIMRFGSDVQIFSCAWKGTGDYYMCSMYLDAWLKEHNKNNFLFLHPGGAEGNVFKMFPYLEKHNEKINGWDFRYLRSFCGFLKKGETNFLYLHHQNPFVLNAFRNVSNNELMGWRGLEMIDFYLYCGFELPRNTVLYKPVFSNDTIAIENYFEKYNLNIGKTVLLSPYSTGLKEHLPSNSFWKKLAKILNSRGFTVCCNCSGNEKPIEGTSAIFIPYKNTVPFLNMAGYFLGLRSGLCDIISTAKCKKIIVHTYKAKFWPDGNSIPYTGLNHMGLCDDAIELEFKAEQYQDELQEKILNYFE